MLLRVLLQREFLWLRCFVHCATLQSRKGVFQLCVNGKGVEILSSSGKVKFKAQYSTSMQVRLL